MYAHARDLLRLGESDEGPGLTAVRGLEHAVAVRDVAADRVLAGADVHDVGVRLAHPERPDGAAEVLVCHRQPGVAAIRRLEDAAARGPHPEFVGTGGRAGHGDRAPAPEDPDLPPLEAGEPGRVIGGGLGGCAARRATEQETQERDAERQRTRGHGTCLRNGGDGEKASPRRWTQPRPPVVYILEAFPCTRSPPSGPSCSHSRRRPPRRSSCHATPRPCFGPRARRPARQARQSRSAPPRRRVDRGAASRIGLSGCHVTMCRMCTFDAPLTVRYMAAIRNAPSTSANPVKALGRKVPVSHTQEGLMKRLLTCSPLAVALALASCDGTATAPPLRPSFDAGGGQGLNLQPGGFGEGSFAAWKPPQGQPDNKGSADAALYFQKMTATATVAAAFAVITGVEGQDVSTLTLSWDHRTDGWCGAGAPRWNVGVKGGGTIGADYTVFLGCPPAHQSGDAPDGWS